MIKSPGSNPAIQMVSDHLFARVMLNTSSSQKSLHAATPFSPGDVICHFHAGSTQSFATYLTVQIGDKKHITLLPEFLQYTNHSCDPTVFFDTTRMELVCLKAMQPGDEFTFFYPSTEWEMAQPFSCQCGSPECLQVIMGAEHLPMDTLEKYRLTDFIREKLCQVHASEKQKSRKSKKVAKVEKQ